MWWERVGRGGAFIQWLYDTSQYFCDPAPLDYKLHGCFSVSPLPPQVGQDGYGGLELGISLPNLEG